MALKRKRSSPTFGSPDTTTTASSTASPLPFYYTQSKPTEALYHKPTWSFPTYESDEPAQTSSRHLNSRTRKRHRDDRPDEQRIYASTIQRLYEAQRAHPRAEPVLSQSMASNANGELRAQSRTLHSFWYIESQPKATMPMVIDSERDFTGDEGLKCEDCDGLLRPDADAMDVDTVGGGQHAAACRICSRRVCDKCAVLGNERVCLGCASRDENR